MTLLGVAGPANAAWDRPHGTGANDGFIDLATARASTPQATVPLAGVVAAGSGPVVGPDGMVYVGVNRKGKPGNGVLLAFRGDGSKAWSRDLPAGQMIQASPVVGADGAVYVVGVAQLGTGPAGAAGYKATLHKFVGGGWYWQVPFPERPGQGRTTAPLNIWRSGGVEVLMIPVIYRNSLTTGFDMRLLAFATDSGGVVADQLASAFVPQVSGGTSSGFPLWTRIACLIPTAWIPCLLDDGTFTGHGEPLPPVPSKDNLPPFELPQAGAAIFSYPGGGTPFVVVSDNLFNLVGYTFSPNGGFQERFRAHDEGHVLRSPPTVLPDGHTLIAGYGSGNGGTAIFAGPNGSAVPAVGGLGSVFAAPTRTADGRVVLVQVGGGLVVLRGGQIESKVEVQAQSIASAAASRTHLFVSTAGALLTFDAGSLQEVARFDWARGGLSSPAIGNKGQVYAVADNKLFVFAGPNCADCPGQVEPVLGIDQPVAAPGESASQTGGATTGGATTGSLNRYDKPSGPGGLRLYACTAVGGNTCGRPVADAYCRGRGWAASSTFGSDNRKMKAETLGGEVCSKKRCKVFDYIACTN